MRKAFFRVLAVVLLALAVPLQGMASVAAGQCMAFGHHQDSGGAQDHEHPAHDDGADGHDHAAQNHADDGQSSHCGPCAACCASASIAAPAISSVLAAPSHVEYLFSPLAPPAVEPHRFDRPPLVL